MGIAISVFTLWTALAGFGTVAIAGGVPQPLKSLHDNSRFSAACSTEELKKLEVEVYSLSGKQQPSKAWRVVSTLLCGEGKKAERFILDHTTEFVAFHFVGTGENDSNVRKHGSLVPLARKQAWDAKVSGNSDIRISYRKNEACITSVDIRYDGVKWRIAAVDEACD